MKNLLLLFAFFCFNSYGQISTDRPSYSISAQTIGKGEFQIEAGFQINNRGQNNPVTNFLQAPIAQFRIGLSDRVELRIQNGLNIRQGPQKFKASMENVELGLKLNLLSGGKSNVSVVLQGIAPTSSGQWQPREKGGRFIIGADHALKKSGTFGYNVGSKFSSVADNDFSLEAYYTLIYSHQMNSKLALYGEVQQLFPSLEEFDIDGMELNVDFGLTFGLTENLQLDYAFGFGLLNRMNFHTVGVSYRFQPNIKSKMH